MQDCFLRMLCELQVHSLRGKSLPREVKLTLSALSKYVKLICIKLSFAGHLLCMKVLGTHTFQYS